MYCNNKYKKNAYKKWHPNLCYKPTPTCPKCPDVDPPEEPTGLYIFEQKGGYYTSFNDVGGTPKTDKTQQEITNYIYTQQQTNEFGIITPNRYAICFLPGEYTYSAPVNVGFYTTLSGLGLTPADVTINSMNNGKENPVRCADRYAATFLDNFWRSCENMTLEGEKTFWYVSQAAPLNNMIIKGNLYLAGTDPPPNPNPDNINDYASGGFIGNSIINGYGVPGVPPPPVISVGVYSQQQWCNLNSSFDTFSNTVWNLTNIGCTGNLLVRGNTPDGSVTQIETTPKIAGKPYLYYDGTVFQIVKPSVKPDIKGPLPLTDLITDYTLIDNIYYANPNELNEIQNKIDGGVSIVLTPGIYNLTDTITISKDGIIILGLGMATLVAPSNGGQAILVKDNVNDLRLSSFIIQANKDNIDPKPKTPVLLQIGETINKNQDSDIFLDNIFIKVGPELIIAPSKTPDMINVDTMLIINTNGVVASNLWLWRADHGPYGSIIGTSKCNNGLIVNGDNVNIYGLFVEHASEKLIQWKGANGKLYFLQSEYPYDAASDFKQPCLTVTGNDFTGKALGIYCYFSINNVTVPTAISCTGENVNIENAFTVWLNYNDKIPATAESVITHVVNNSGEASTKSTKGKPQYVPSYPL
jgi:hypothetical protein